MQLRPLGRSGLRVAPLALGGNVFGWTADEATSFALLDAFVDAGFNLVDTADIYSRWAPGHSGGESEAIIGRWLKASGKRSRVVLATKVGMEMAAGDKGLASARIRRCVEASLRRLQTDCIDLYQAHEDDPATPMEETLATFAELVREGKVAPSAPRTSTPRASPKRWRRAPASACRATRACSRCTTWRTARPTRPSWSRCAARRGSQ